MILYIDANLLYGWAMRESLPYDENNFDRNVNLEVILNTDDDSDIGYFVEVDLRYPDNKIEQTKDFPFAPEKMLPIILHHGRMRRNQMLIDKKWYYFVIGLIKKIVRFTIGCWIFIPDMGW